MESGRKVTIHCTCTPGFKKCFEIALPVLHQDWALVFNKVFDQGKKVIEGPDIALIGYDYLLKLK